MWTVIGIAGVGAMFYGCYLLHPGAVWLLGGMMSALIANEHIDR